MELINTKIISAFPGTGKSVCHSKNPDTTLDSDSSNFSWVKDVDGNNTTERNPDFPQNYMDHIMDNIGKYEYIFVSSHEEVRNALIDNGIFHYVVYPDIERKYEFLQRYKDRGNSDGFLAMMDEHWEEWIDGMEGGNEDYCLIFMSEGNLEDLLPYLDINDIEYGSV